MTTQIARSAGSMGCISTDRTSVIIIAVASQSPGSLKRFGVRSHFHIVLDGQCIPNAITTGILCLGFAQARIAWHSVGFVMDATLDPRRVNILRAQCPAHNTSTNHPVHSPFTHPISDPDEISSIQRSSNSIVPNVGQYEILPDLRLLLDPPAFINDLQL